MNAITRWFTQARLQTRIMLTLVFVVLLQATISGSFTLHYIKVVLEDRIGDQALQLSRVVSALPQFRQGLIDRDVDQIQPLAELVGQNIGISRTTARRYLEYLVSTNELAVDVTYGGVGRLNATIADCNPDKSALQYQYQALGTLLTQ